MSRTESTLEKILRRATLREIGPGKACVVAPEAPLSEVLQALDKDEFGAVVVCRDGRPVGIFTERDVLYRTALEDIDGATPIEELMTPEPRTLSLTDHVADAVAEMTRGGLRHIPLVDGEGRVTGIVSSRAVLRFIAGHYPESVLNLPPRLRQRMTTAEGG